MTPLYSRLRYTAKRLQGRATLLSDLEKCQIDTVAAQLRLTEGDNRAQRYVRTVIPSASCLLLPALACL